MWWEEEQASSGPRVDSRGRNDHASVSTAPALSGRWPGHRGRSRSSPCAWTHGPGASCTSSPAAGWNQQRRSAEKALNSCTFSRTRKIGGTHKKQLGISNVGFLKLWLQSFPKSFLVPPFLLGLGKGQLRGGAWVCQQNQFLSALSFPTCFWAQPCPFKESDGAKNSLMGPGKTWVIAPDLPRGSPWESHLFYLSLSFLICRSQIMIPLYLAGLV